MLKKLILIVSLILTLNSCGVLSAIEFAGDVSRNLIPFGEQQQEGIETEYTKSEFD